ncbi:ABC transporter ATP-binding protein [Clostridium felsineum]|uniref:ABC transporter ATP-binding protein n=1 Tax=Clostridium felsineum TaxID=36839 RepID=UPI00098C98F5|nr:ABC transporter ATP-binding protein [Clostridium felsineum]URZ17796.1 Bacitracin transport ATP-binding protein BcrA [Clostridium felsineum DSM 794]
MENILKTNNLLKKYKDKIAVNKVNITINRGDIYGFLGENGAGKTATIKMIMGQEKSDEGTIELFGETININSYIHKNRIGILPEKQIFYPMLTAKENLEIHRRYLGVQNKKKIDEVLSLVKLNGISKSVDKFSTEMKQRLGLARALLNEPELLILDELTKGLDTAAINEIKQIIITLNKRKNVTVLVCSNKFHEVENWVSKVGIIHRGNLVKEVLYKDLNQKNRVYLKLRVSNLEKACVILEKNCCISNYKIFKNNSILIFEKLDNVEDINKQLVDNGIGISELKIHTENIEDYFFRLIKGEKYV